MADRVALRGITGFGHHGVFPEEREAGQPFVVDVLLTVDLLPAASSDDLQQTVDYGVLAQSVVSDIERDPLDLIEALALRIADRCLDHPRVEVAEVTVHKPGAPLPVTVGDVAVTLTRSK
jgi:dihydroneopterin aldolase